MCVSERSLLYLKSSVRCESFTMYIYSSLCKDCAMYSIQMVKQAYVLYVYTVILVHISYSELNKSYDFMTPYSTTAALVVSAGHARAYKS